MHPDIFQSATSWIRSPEWKFLITLWIRNRQDSKTGYFLSSNVTRSSPVLNREYSRQCRAQCCCFFISCTSVSSLITCVQLILAHDYCTLQSCQTASRHFEASFHVGRTNWTPYKQVKRAKKWDNFVTETAIEEDWRQNVRMIRRSLYKLANEIRLNPDTCRILVEGQFRVELLYGYVWTWKFLNQQGKICGFKTIRGP